MIFRPATHHDIPQIAALEALPQFRTFVSTWPAERHHKTLDDPDSCYTVVQLDSGEIAGYAILLGLQSEHKSLLLQRIVVGTPNRGIGRKLFEFVVKKTFDEYGAHRLWFDVFEHNSRARHIYKSFGFREDGIFREAEFRDGQYHSLRLMSMLDREYRELHKQP